MKWLVLLFVVVMCQLSENVRVRRGLQRPGPGYSEESGIFPEMLDAQEYLESTEIVSTEALTTVHDGDTDPPDPLYPVQHAGVPRDLVAEALQLPESDHELMFNVSWLPPLGPPARDYSLEVHSETDTVDCRMTMCYEYNIPGSATWWAVPAHASPVTETCAVRPGCRYNIRLIAHPWDGRTAVTLQKPLDECVAGVCSCAHSPRLPAPVVSAGTLTVGEDLFVNISWTLPPPTYPQRLPKGLHKKSYFLSIGQQMVSDAHPSPWFAHTITRYVAAGGLIATGDEPRFFVLSTVEKVGERKKKPANVKLLARVSVVDERGCMGPAGNATAYDPAKASKVSIASYILWATLGAAIVLGMAAALACGAGAAKRVLRALRPAPVSAPLDPLLRAWFPLQLNTLFVWFTSILSPPRLKPLKATSVQTNYQYVRKTYPVIRHYPLMQQKN